MWNLLWAGLGIAALSLLFPTQVKAGLFRVCLMLSLPLPSWAKLRFLFVSLALHRFLRCLFGHRDANTNSILRGAPSPSLNTTGWLLPLCVHRVWVLAS